MTKQQFLGQDAIEQSMNPKFHLLDVEVRWNGISELYSGVWSPVNGTVYRVLQVGAQGWDNFLNQMKPKNGRFLDMEVGYSGFLGKRWSGIFLEDGDDYAFDIRTTNTEEQFQTLLEKNQRAGLQIIDFEAYQLFGGLGIRYAGVWVADPNQPRTHLYYGLESADVSDLLRPLAGRVIDFERYFSPIHGENRYALIVAAWPGPLNEWALWRGQSKTKFKERDTSIQNLGIPLIDIEVYRTSEGIRYAGVWGETFKSLHEVPAVPAENEPEPMGPLLPLVIQQFEAPDTNGSQGRVGFYARNVRSGQSIGFRASEPFYLASTTKTLAHARLWQMFEDGDRDRLVDMIQYTKGLNSRDRWYVDERGFPGLSSNVFGQSFNLDRLDQGMMQTSDNAATSMLIDDPVEGIGRDDLNRWVSGIDGVGRGFGLLTAITDLDRVIMWQGQVDDFPSDMSYFLIPTFNWEPWFRTFSPSVDTFGDLQAWANANNGGVIPGFSWHNGHLRYFRMGLNSAEPRAYGQFLDKYMSGDFFDDPATWLPLSLANMGTGNPLDDFLIGAQAVPPPLPPGNTLQRWAKNGGKGGTNTSGSIRHRVTVDTAIFQKGPETIVMGVFSKDNVRTGGAIRAQFMPWFGYELFQRLIPDLKDAGTQFAGFAPGSVSPGGNFSVFCDVVNARGGDTVPFKVKFYASTDVFIDETDFLIGTFDTPTGMKGNSTADVFLQTNNFPVMPDGIYYVGWVIDHPDDDEVGEWDDRLEDNRAVIVGSGIDSRLFVTRDLNIRPPPTMPPGDNVLEVLVFHDRECDGVFDAGLDEVLTDVMVTMEFTSGQSETVKTGRTGLAAFSGFVIPDTAKVFIHLPLDERGLEPVMCADSSTEFRLTQNDFATGGVVKRDFRIAGPQPAGRPDMEHGGPDGGHGDDPKEDRP